MRAFVQEKDLRSFLLAQNADYLKEIVHARDPISMKLERNKAVASSVMETSATSGADTLRGFGLGLGLG